MLTSGVVDHQLVTVNKKIHSLSHGTEKVLAMKLKIIEHIHSDQQTPLKYVRSFNTRPNLPNIGTLSEPRVGCSCQ